MKTKKKECPCGTGARYDDCCKPRHDGTRPAETPEALMRSRYSAFALGLGAYLVDTLARDHDDRKLPRDVLVRELSRVKDTKRFMGLRIVEAIGDEVLFFARVFEKGKDESFAERSTFVREDGAWKYAHGSFVDPSTLPPAA